MCQLARQEEDPLETPTDDYDSPWKEALEEYLEAFFALFLPQAHAEIDWSRPPVFLDTELQQVVRDAELGRRLADRLVRVWRRGGDDAWVLVHLEVQGREEPAFAERMFDYYARIRARYNRRVASVAVLADERSSWRPDTFEEELWGCALHFQFPVIKLADWRRRRAELEGSDNPFATVVLAHLAAQDTKGDAEGRERAKLGLIRRLYERGYDRERVLSLFRFIDWLLALPPEIEARVLREVEAIEEEREMPYITSVERHGLEQGRVEGRVEGQLDGKRQALRLTAQARFGEVPEALEQRAMAADEAGLDALLARVAQAAQLADI